MTIRLADISLEKDWSSAPRHPLRRVASNLQEELPVTRSCSRTPLAGRLIGKPHRTNGRAAKPRLGASLSRFILTSRIDSAWRSFCFDISKSPASLDAMPPAASSRPDIARTSVNAFSITNRGREPCFVPLMCHSRLTARPDQALAGLLNA